MANTSLPKEQLFILLVLASINFCHIMDFMIMMPMAPQLMRSFSIGPQQFSLLVASYSIAAGFASFMGTFLVDHFDRKRVLLFCFTGFLIGTFGCGFAPTYSILLAARIFTGMLGGLIGSQVLSILADLVAPENRGKATGMVMTGFSAASVFGVPVGLYAAAEWNWKLPFFGIGFLGISIWILAFLVLPSVRKHIKEKSQRKNPVKTLTEILSFRSHQLALGFTVLVAFSHFTMIPFLSPYMVANVGFKEVQLSYIYMIGGLLTLFSGPYIGKLADRYGTARVFSILVVVAFIPQLAITNLPPVHIGVALIFTSLFFVFSGGRFVPSQALIIGAIQPAFRGGFMSLNSSVMQLASGLAAYMAGLVVVKNPNGQFENYNLIGYTTLFFSILTIILARKLKA